MFLKAAERHNLDMAASWTVGDSPRDVEAGRRAGCGRTVLVSDSENSEYADWVVPDMSALIRLLKKELEINEH
jgi:histidinol phosphatase-like enzyme